MKIKLLFFLSLVTAVANAQTLNLKTAQKFSYEGISKTDWKEGEGFSHGYTYWKTNFKVASQKNGIYTLIASPKLILSTWRDGIIFDSQVALSEQPNDFSAVSNKVLTNMSYELNIDKNGNIKSINGLAEIKAAVLNKVKEMHVPETSQKNKDLADMLISDEWLKMLSSFFKRRLSDLDSIYSTSLNNEITRTIFKRATRYSDNSGLIKYANFDSTSNTTSLTGKKVSDYAALLKFNLIPLVEKSNSIKSSLFAEAKNVLNYGDYYSPINKATRKIHALAELFNNQKGSQTIEKIILRKLDSLDKGFAKDDYQYLGAKLGILTYLNDGAYAEILKQVPYKYLPDENDVQNKMINDLEDGNCNNVKEAIELCFTKFKGEDYYPLNMSNVSDAIHNYFGGLVFRLKNRDSLTATLSIIKQLEALKKPMLTETLTGLKTYVSAKLATSQIELNEVSNTQFNSPYDKAGRYRLLIYDELQKKHVPDSILVAYVDYTIDLDKRKLAELESKGIENVNSFEFKYMILPNKAIYKKNLADAYYRKSQLQNSLKTEYLQMAADYLPSQQDIIDNEFGLETEYKFTPFLAYNDLYLASGGNSAIDDSTRMQKYVDMVIMEPIRYKKLKEDYKKAFPNGDFKLFFNAALKAKLPVVPQFSLKERSGMVLANNDQKNKFVFVDFWGTWCGACVGEIHKIEEVNLQNPNPEKLMVTTIACFDKKKNVDDFMTDRKYTYQVLISDGQIEKDFKIRGYPTKLLFLPNGVYLTIPYYSDYQDILKQYLAWEI